MVSVLHMFSLHPLAANGWHISDVLFTIYVNSHDRYLLEPIEWPKGSKASCEVWKSQALWEGDAMAGGGVMAFPVAASLLQTSISDCLKCLAFLTYVQ